MKWNAVEEEQCSVARTVAVIGDRWSLLILRDCFLRVRRFEDFQARLGITRQVRSDRLKKLCRHGVLRRVPYQSGPRPFHGKVESEIPKSRGSKLKSISRTAAARGHQFLSQGVLPARVRCLSRQRRIWSI